MITATSIKDQELAIIAERPRINHPAVTRSCDLAAGAPREGEAFFRAAVPIGSPELLDSVPAHRKRQETFGRREGNRLGETHWWR